MTDVDLPRFFKVFVSSYSDSLHIPISYYGQLPHRLPRTTTLRGKGGRVWKVLMKRMDDEVHFTKGWSNFVKENSLVDGDFMTFVYKGDCVFLVSVYDSFTGCAKDKSETRANVNLRSKNKGKSKVEDVEESDDSDSDDEDYVEAKTKRGRRGKSKRGPKTKKGKVDFDPERLLAGRKNPHFVTTLKNRPQDLFVERKVIKNFELEFEPVILYKDDIGTLQTISTKWKDQRVSIKKWNCICERNNVKDEDEILCELLCNGRTVHTVKIHIVREKDMLV